MTDISEMIAPLVLQANEQVEWPPAVVPILVDAQRKSAAFPAWHRARSDW